MVKRVLFVDKTARICYNNDVCYEALLCTDGLRDM